MRIVHIEKEMIDAIIDVLTRINLVVEILNHTIDVTKIIIIAQVIEEIGMDIETEEMTGAADGKMQHPTTINLHETTMKLR